MGFYFLSYSCGGCTYTFDPYLQAYKLDEKMIEVHEPESDIEYYGENYQDVINDSQQTIKLSFELPDFSANLGK